MSDYKTDVPVSIPQTPTTADYATEQDRPLIPDVDEPFELFRLWLKEANATEINDSTAMSLATVDASGQPDVRIVLLRGLGDDGLLKFYTNYDSDKGRQIDANPSAALCLHWKSLRRQVRIRGIVKKLPGTVSDEYFNQRAAQSRIAAIASDQSRPLEDRDTFQRKVAEITSIYGDDRDIPRPAHWGGYGVQVEAIEFWQDQAFRMHDRLRLTRTSAGWASTRLYP
ncbi:MAG: pyridoxamine 5'-phosphate oxidase [Pseudomonadota bacterium]